MIQPTPGPNGHVYLVSAARTPIGKFGGALAGVPATELGGVAIRAAVERAGLDPAIARIDEVLMGQVLQAGAGQAPARQAALKAGVYVLKANSSMADILKELAGEPNLVDRWRASLPAVRTMDDVTRDYLALYAA